MTKSRRIQFHRIYVTILALLLLAVPVFSWAPHVYAGFLDQREVVVGTSTPSAVTTHTFNFTIETSAITGSIRFQYCDNSPLYGTPCNPPAGLGLSVVTLTNQSGETGFTSTAPVNPNEIIISRTPTLAASVPVSYQFSNITNPSAIRTSIYVRIQTFASNDATGNPIDTGSVVFSTSGSFNAQAFVPPYLTFCVGVTVAVDCSTTNGDFIDFGELSTTASRYATIQFAGATNVDIGYVVAFSGTPLTSGNNVINPLGSPTPSVVGTPQFGFNLRANSSPPIGNDPTGRGTAVPTANYNIPNQYLLVDGDVIAQSPITTDFNVFTVSYITNINKAQQPGVYTTTNTYIATAQF